MNLFYKDDLSKFEVLERKTTLLQDINVVVGLTVSAILADNCLECKSGGKFYDFID